MLNENVKKLLAENMWDLATCVDNEPNVVPVAFKDVTEDGTDRKIRRLNGLLLEEMPEHRKQTAQFTEERMKTKCENIYKENFPFWEKISDADREYICQNSHMLTYPKGRNIHNGEECSGVIFVRSGSLRLYIMSDEGKEITLYRLHRGDLCMLSASCVLDAVTFDVFVDAEEDSQCCVVSGPAFAAVSQRNPDIRIFALETAVSRFSDVMWVMQQVLFMSMDKRLAIFLSDESARTGSDTVTLTHGQIARYMGSAHEVVSRMLKYFAGEGIVEVSRGGVTILDKKRLRDLAL